MRSCLFSPRKLLLVRITLIAALTLLLSGWTTCNGMFVGCQDSVPQPQITSLSPATIPADAEPVLLIVNGSGFVPQSRIMWNGSALQTTFIDSDQLQTAITEQILNSFGDSARSTMQISVRSLGSGADLGCPVVNSGTLVLIVN